MTEPASLGLSDTGFETFAHLLRTVSGQSLGRDRAYLLDTRLRPMLRRHGLPSLDALAERLRHDGPAHEEGIARDVVEAMTTNESLFFRDGTPFAHLRESALPRLRAARPQAPIRLWSAGASTGQEAYSMAMALARAGQGSGERGAAGYEVLGTDIARGPLARARVGRYSDFEVRRGLPPDLLHRFFRPEAGAWQVDPALRRTVTFREHNLLHPLPDGCFDVVFCRNVLIYFDVPERRRALDTIARQMPRGGILYLGTGETLAGITDAFAPCAPGIYGRT